MNAHLDLPPLEVLNDRFKYDPETGILTRIRWGYGPAGYLTSTGYLRVKVNDTHYRVARLVWKMHYGEDPPKNMSIDHINRDRTDNRIANLRLVTHQENILNTARVLFKKPTPPLKTAKERTNIRKKAAKKLQKPVILTRPDGQEVYYESVTEASRSEHLNSANLCNVLKGRYKHHKGYTARYA